MRRSSPVLATEPEANEPDVATDGSTLTVDGTPVGYSSLTAPGDVPWHAADVDIVLRSVADAMGTTPDVAENSGCEATRPHPKYDLFFPGQSVVKAVMAGDGQWHMVRSFPWGTVQAVPFFGGAINGRAAEYKSRRRLFRWWEGPSTTTKLTTKFAPEGQIVTRCAGGRKKEPYRKVVFTSDLQRQTFCQLFIACSGNVGL